MKSEVSEPMESLFSRAKACLDCCDLEQKLALTKATAQAWRDGKLSLEEETPPESIGEPGRPAKPEMVSPHEVPKRSFYSTKGKAALFHSIAHIEFNAIDLGWDAVYRFRDMPEQFYSDWIQVADEEAYHFELIREHLNELGYDYGDFVAHKGLWEMAQDTAFDVMVRMALVPRVLEARGLDVTPGIMKRLQKAGDEKAVAILEIIHRDEVGHVEIGTRWFHHSCQQRSLDPEKTFFELLNEYMKSGLKGPFNLEARIKAGFTQSELERLEGEGR